VREVDYKVDGGRVIRDPSKRGYHQVVYSPAGYKVDENRYDDNDGVEIKIVYRYDDKWNLLEARTFHDGTEKSKLAHAYDARGNKTEDRYYEADGKMVIKKVYVYDANGKWMGLDSYDRNGVLSDRYTFIYDAGGHRVEDRVHDEKGGLLWRATRVFEKGRTLEYRKFNADGSPDDKHTMAYDDDGNMTMYDFHFPPYSWRRVYAYDAKGNRTEVRHYDNKGEYTHRERFEHDDQGNWVRRYYEVPTGVIHVTERTIVYY
jgi:hypothetical protein